MDHLENARSGRAPDVEYDATRRQEQWKQWITYPEAWLPPLILVSLLLAWELSVNLDRLSALFFPAPSMIIRTLFKLIWSGELIIDLSTTLGRFLQGLLFGGGTGLLLGIIMGWSQRLRVVVDPFIAAIHPIPKISLLPIIMLIFGIGETPKVILISLSAFFPLLINTMAGVRQINQVYFDVAQNYGASSIKVFQRVVVPGSLPLILTGARLALNSGLVVTIAVELLTAQQGLGATIWLAWETLRTEELYVTLLVTAILGITSNRILQYLNQWLVRWQVE